MPPRNHKSWLAQPNIESISSSAYNSPEIFAQEQERIFSKVWVPICHISEMYKQGDFRTSQIAGVNVLAYNTGKRVHAWRNYGVSQPSGTFKAPVVTSEPKLHCEEKHGGMVWVTIDPNPTQSVEESTPGPLHCIAVAIDTVEMDVLH